MLLIPFNDEVCDTQTAASGFISTWTLQRDASRVNSGSHALQPGAYFTALRKSKSQPWSAWVT
jgi:hypothetical protein